MKNCSNLNGKYGCKGGQTDYPSDWDENIFQIPQSDDELGNYRKAYQDIIW